MSKPKLNIFAIANAAHTLKLTHPITMRLVSKFDQDIDDTLLDGLYDQPLHTVLIYKRLSSRRIDLVGWHELGHALQCERDFNGDYRAFHQMVKREYQAHNVWDAPQPDDEHDFRRRMWSIPFEIEAENIAERYARVAPLTY